MNITVDLDDPTQLTVRFQGWLALFTLKRRLVVPRANIIDIQWAEDFIYRDGWLWRWAGTGMPGVLYAGTFRSFGANARRYFLYIIGPKQLSWLTLSSFRASQVMTVTTAGYRYQKILLTMPKEGYDKFFAWWRKGSASSSQE